MSTMFKKLDKDGKVVYVRQSDGKILSRMGRPKAGEKSEKQKRFEARVNILARNEKLKNYDNPITRLQAHIMDTHNPSIKRAAIRGEIEKYNKGAIDFETLSEELKKLGADKDAAYKQVEKQKAHEEYLKGEIPFEELVAKTKKAGVFNGPEIAQLGMFAHALDNLHEKALEGNLQKEDLSEIGKYAESRNAAEVFRKEEADRLKKEAEMALLTNEVVKDLAKKERESKNLEEGVLAMLNEKKKVMDYYAKHGDEATKKAEKEHTNIIEAIDAFKTAKKMIDYRVTHDLQATIEDEKKRIAKESEEAFKSGNSNNAPKKPSEVEISPKDLVGIKEKIIKKIYEETPEVTKAIERFVKVSPKGDKEVALQLLKDADPKEVNKELNKFLKDKEDEIAYHKKHAAKLAGDEYDDKIEEMGNQVDDLRKEIKRLKEEKKRIEAGEDIEHREPIEEEEDDPNEQFHDPSEEDAAITEAMSVKNFGNSHMGQIMERLAPIISKDAGDPKEVMKARRQMEQLVDAFNNIVVQGVDAKGRPTFYIESANNAALDTDLNDVSILGLIRDLRDSKSNFKKNHIVIALEDHIKTLPDSEAKHFAIALSAFPPSIISQLTGVSKTDATNIHKKFNTYITKAYEKRKTSGAAGPSTPALIGKGLFNDKISSDSNIQTDETMDKEKVRKIITAAMAIAETGQTELAFELLDTIPDGSISKVKLMEVVMYINQYASAAGGN